MDKNSIRTPLVYAASSQYITLTVLIEFVTLR